MKEKSTLFSIFGATGDLTHRKLLPALYYLEQERLLSPEFKIIGIARKEKTHEQFRAEAQESIKKFSRIKVSDNILDKLLSRIFYQRLDFNDSADYLLLKNSMQKISGEKCEDCNRIFYLAVPPSLFGTIARNLKNMKLDLQKDSFTRVMFEKPFGHDLRSANELNKEITGVFDENQIYRIDHYMAKELVQNMLVLRFANSIFEPLWNKEYIDHVQITVAETLGVETRGDYYDKFGALRDVIQNHMMQLLTLVAMQEPKSLNVEDIRLQKINVLKSISLNKKQIEKYVVNGQYEGGVLDGKQIPAYVDEPDVDKNSRIETFAALKLEINNKMWKGVPFYLRTGKRLKDRATEIVIVYKDIPFGLFSNSNPDRNMMVIRVQPYEGITLQFNAKVPGNRVIVDNVTMDFCHECKFGPNSPEAYERLLYDAMIGDQTLFTSWFEVENAWRIIDPLIRQKSRPKKYKPGAWGPQRADKMIERDGRKWVEPKRPAYAEQLDMMNPK